MVVGNRVKLTRSTNWLSSALSASMEAEAAPALAAMFRFASMTSRPCMISRRSAASACQESGLVKWQSGQSTPTAVGAHGLC